MFSTLRSFAWLSLVSFVSLGLSIGVSRVAAQALPQTLQVAMPDGVTLATDVWRPVFDANPRPVLLRRTPYGRAIDFATAQNLVNAGLIVVSQDVRGRGDSGGEFEPFFDDKVDGEATLEWIAAQDWSTGKVATYGASAEGIVQYMAMAKAPEALRCTHIGMPTHDVYAEMFPGGAWRTELNTRWLTDLGAASVVELWKGHEVRDVYWDDATLSPKEMATVDHPVFILGGFFDVFAHSQVRALRELQANVKASRKKDMFLIMGPWTHGGVVTPIQGQLVYPEDAAYADYVPDFVSYLSWCVQDGPRPTFAQVRYYLSEVTDEWVADPVDTTQQRIKALGEWREAETFPPADVKTVRLYMHEEGALHGDLPSATSSPHSVPVDPADPVPSLGGGNLTTAAGPFDQASVDLRDDVWLVQTEPVTEPVEVVGSIRALLWAASATTDADVIVRVEVLTPMGKAVAMTDGVQRGRFVRDFSAIHPLTPDEPVRFELTLGPIAVRLPVGYALRFAISGTSSPRYEPGPNVAEALADKPSPQATTLTFYRDSAHPSEFRIPVLRGNLPHAVEVTEPESDPDAVPGAGEDAGVEGPTDSDASMWPSPDSQGDPGSDIPAQGCGCRVGAAGGASRLSWMLPLALVGLWLGRRLRRHV